jgi:hypothetical protein
MMMQKYLLVILLAGSLYSGYGQSARDSVAIRALLEKESATWRSGDIQGHADCWVIQPYSRILISLGDGRAIDIPPAMMIQPPADMVGEGGHAILTNFRMSIQGNNAWVSHDEESVSKEGVSSFSYEIRLLEKIKGQWKLVGQSIHIYKSQ